MSTATILSSIESSHLRLNADCVPVVGATRMAIYDLTRHEIVIFPREYHMVLAALATVTVGSLVSGLRSRSDVDSVLEFVTFLVEHELVTPDLEVSAFPAIDEKWDVPALVDNAIIDVDGVRHNFDAILRELSELGCRFLEIRCFSSLLSVGDLHDVLALTRHRSFESVDLLLRFDPAVCDSEYVTLLASHPIVTRLTVHSSPRDYVMSVDFDCSTKLTHPISKSVCFVERRVTSERHCGVIVPSTLNAPSARTVNEARLYNGCLNRKISVDRFGAIRNCPSMARSYGDANVVRLRQVVESEEFRVSWGVNKDQISKCRDCELRYACSDCRAYVENPSDHLSKPLKCGYDPYTGKWEDWRADPRKRAAIIFYGLDSL